MKGLDVLVAVPEVVPGEAGEDLQDVRCGGGGAAAVFGVERQLSQPVFGHGGADLAFDERLDEHGNHGEGGPDGGWVVPDGGTAWQDAAVTTTVIIT